MSAATPQQDNPLAAGLERLPVHPTAITIFGATGDLAQRKLLPALYNLAHDGALPERFNLIGTSRSEHSDDEFRELAADAIRRYSRRAPDEQVLDAPARRGPLRPGLVRRPDRLRRGSARCSASSTPRAATR